MKKLAIFRNQLFKNSEAFISNQADKITDFEVIYVGRRIVAEQNRKNYYVINDDGIYSQKINEIINAVTTLPCGYDRLEKLDIMHAHFAIDAVYALPIAARQSIPLVTTLHGFDVTIKTKKIITSLSPSLLNYKLHTAQLKREGSLFLCVSDFIREKALAAGFPDKKLITHYIGIEDNTVNNINIKKERVFLHIARLVEKKGTLDIIDAVKKIENKLNGFKIKIVGNGPLYNDIKNKIDLLGLNRHIELVGEVKHKDIMKIIQSSSVLLAPSITAKNGDSEGLPTVILEAAAAGVSTIGTHHAGIPEAILDGKTGFLVNERNISDLAERMLHFINHESDIAKYGNEANIFVKNKFNLEKQTQLLQQYYSKLI
ncbi:glycosyltransferase [Klebsiella indica]|uniref:Glycosyltransferase n=1 Tax=Klebsiella indica TaxID=2582917 RepID=A0A5R9LKU9_9ENTR|nr:glycosyltransferase [Klebsiella indica]TLV21532.1 glycosyltransferase [Klebsiella indica]